VLRIEQRAARLLDRVQHPERWWAALLARRKVRFAIAGEKRVRVRVDQTGHNDAPAQIELFNVLAIEGSPFDFGAFADGRNLRAFDEQRPVVDSAQSIEIDAALLGAGIAGNERLRADELYAVAIYNRQSIPFASAVSIAIS
jgi:hypothetical protein